jgi:hypothetical protein
VFCGLDALYPDLGKIPIIILIFSENAPLFPKNLQFFLIFFAKSIQRAIQHITNCQSRFYEPTMPISAPPILLKKAKICCFYIDKTP